MLKYIEVLFGMWISRNYKGIILILH